jgi:hypothetical protein
MALSKRLTHLSQEAMMAAKAHSGQKNDKQSKRKKKEPNLGQKEARQQQQSESRLGQMGAGQSPRSNKDKRQQG